METNHEKFNYYVGTIFALLHDSFPRRTSLDFLSLIGAESCDESRTPSGSSTGKYLIGGEVVDAMDELDFVYETANWLFETGYLIGDVGHGRLGRRAVVTLSPKALEILKVVPSSISQQSERKSIGQEISEAAKSAAKKKVGELANEALSYVIKASWDAATR